MKKFSPAISAIQLTTVVLLSTLNPRLSTVFAQGSLTPPGAPAATMKSLAQIEPRTPISSAPFTISLPGSYYLTTNLTTGVSNAMVIAANGVTLDLSGFTIYSTVASAAAGGSAILLGSGLSDITILNGHIRSGVTNNGSGIYSGSGFATGIYYSALQPRNIRVSGVSVSGCLGFGIYLNVGDSTLVESCTVSTMGNAGIRASIIKNSTAVDCGGSAIYGDQVSDCRGKSSGGGYGVYATAAQNCHGTSDDATGVFATTAQNCYGYNGGSSGYGLYAVGSATGCYGYSTSGTGLYAFIANVCRGQTSSGTALSTPHNVNSF